MMASTRCDGLCLDIHLTLGPDHLSPKRLPPQWGGPSSLHASSPAVADVSIPSATKISPSPVKCRGGRVSLSSRSAAKISLLFHTQRAITA